MSNYLKVTADVEDDGTVGLTGVVSSNGFSGSGEAWFNISEVKQFISQLESFAKSTENPPEITGGNWDGEGNLLHKLFSLRFYSFSSFRAGVQVELAHHPYTDCRIEEVSSVKLELKPEAQSILNFCGQLNELLSNNISEASLIC
ncbi:hypothetical protein ACUR5C_00280 [Aliikangiella sp. IMCC44653]